MLNIPNIVRERLRAEVVESEHPEANILSAFAQDALSLRERGLVIDHLARCRECRDVVALALPASEPADVAGKAAHAHWLAWPALRWGFAVAGVAIIASFAALQYRHRQPAPVAKLTARSEVQSTSSAAPATTVNSSSSGQIVSNQNSKLEAPTTTPALPKDAERRTNGGAFLARNLAVPEPGAQAPTQAHTRGAYALHSNTRNAGAIGGASGFGPKIPAPGQQQQQVRQYVQSLGGPIPATNPQGTIANTAPAPKTVTAEPKTVTVEVSGEAPLVETQAQNLDTHAQNGNTRALNLDIQAQDLHAASSMPPTGQPSGDDGSRLSRAKSATAPQPVHAPVAELPRWNINADGKLQRSLDQGQSWQDIDVTAANAPVSAASGMALRFSNAASSNQVAGKALAKKQAPARIFRAVVANGMDVWAGGAAGALYHSVDAGDHWTSVVPSDGSSTLAADIVSMDFPDAQHGKITTSYPDTWITEDAGKTWHKR